MKQTYKWKEAHNTVLPALANANYTGQLLHADHIKHIYCAIITTWLQFNCTLIEYIRGNGHYTPLYIFDLRKF